MSEKVEKFRKLLTRNKIIFETAMSSLLALMAIIVSVAQAFIAESQTSIARLQTNIAEAQALPQFDLSIHQRQNPDTGNYDDNDLLVKNEGGLIKNFNLEVRFSLKITTTKSGLDQIISTFPVNGYFSTKFISSSGKGELATITGYRNNEKSTSIQRKVSEIAHDHKIPYANVDEIAFAKISYYDLLNRKHIEYYEIRWVGPGVQVPDEVGSPWFKEDPAKPMIELSNINPEQLLENILKHDGPGQSYQAFQQ